MVEMDFSDQSATQCCVFYPFGELFFISLKSKIVVCKLFHFFSFQNLSFGKGIGAFFCFAVFTLILYCNGNYSMLCERGLLRRRTTTTVNIDPGEDHAVLGRKF